MFANASCVSRSNHSTNSINDILRHVMEHLFFVFYPANSIITYVTITIIHTQQWPNQSEKLVLSTTTMIAVYNILSR